MDLTSNIANEKIQRAAVLVLADGLNDKIDALQTAWALGDTAFYTAMGRPTPNFTVEHIELDNMYPGTVPSLIKAPVGMYPNLCVIAYVANPKNSSDDYAEQYTITMNVEVMCKSDNFEADLSHLGEEQVNSRIQKTLEAVHEVIMDNRTLGNVVMEIGAQPRQTIGDVFVRRQENAQGPRWFWQGGILTYPIDKYVSF